MNKFFGAVLLLFSFSSFAQDKLNSSTQNSRYTYIYPVNNITVQGLYDGKKLEEEQLKMPVDSFLTIKGKQPSLPKGNYLKIYAEKNQLVYGLIENRTAYFKLLSNEKELQFVITDPKGKALKDALVSINGKKISFDQQLDFYHTSSPRKEENLVRVDYKGVANFTSLSFDKETNKRYINSPKRSRGYIPIKPSLFSGYMVFNKPKYKPLDSVKFKAFIVQGKSHQPVSRKLQVRITGSNYYKLIGEISPEHKGAYDFAFKLHDSLKMVLDRNYTVELYENDKVYSRGYFQYEDYELKAITFTVSGEKEQHSLKEQQSLRFKAIDENGLNVMDGRVELVIRANNIQVVGQKSLFIPDTLWHHQFKLDPIGDTKVVLPDSIFPNIGLNYSVDAQFFNAQNEKSYAQASFSFLEAAKQALKFEATADSLAIRLLQPTISSTFAAQINALNAAGDLVETYTLKLPATLKINPHVQKYDVTIDTLTQTFNLNELRPEINVYGQRTKDSLLVTVDNPRKIPFWYSVIKGNKVVDRGYAVDLKYKKALNQRDKTTFLYHYIWGDISQSNRVEAQFAEKQLHLEVKQPVVIAPGEKVEVELAVRDAKGAAVEDVDVTAFALTSKFRYMAPYIPYLGKSWTAYKPNPTLEKDEGVDRRRLPLNWKRWAKEYGLDSIAYYHFIHPDPVFRWEEDTKQQVTQIVPFVIDKGNVMPVEVLYINEMPVYFSQAEQVIRYAFKVTPGLVNLKFRFKNKLVEVEDVKVEKGKRLVISFNLDTVSHQLIKIIPMQATLTDDEAARLNNYMVRVSDHYSPRFATLSTPDQVFLLQPVQNIYSWNNQQPKLVGPLAYNFVEYKTKGLEAMTFKAEPNFVYDFQPGLIRQKSTEGKYNFNTTLSSQHPLTYRDSVLTNNDIDSLWLDYLDLRSYTTTIFSNPSIHYTGSGRLDLNFKFTGEKPLVKNILVYSNDNPDFLNIYPGRQTNLGNFLPGKYRIMVLLKGDRYVLLENVLLKAYGRNILQVSLDQPRPKDDLSSKISAFMIEKSIALQVGEQPTTTKIKEVFNNKFIPINTYEDVMSGVVLSKEGKTPLPSVSISIKGTSFWVRTDVNGQFSIKVPKRGLLTISYIGFNEEEVKIKHSTGNKIFLEESTNSLNEVVVVGYGAQHKMISQELLERVSDVQTNSTGSMVSIRGTNSVSGASGPLYIVDGVVMEDAMKTLKPDDIEELTMLKDAAAVAIYGSRAANGVIMITTKKAKEKAMVQLAANDGAPPSSIRKNFADDAFWQPKLR
ncbi:carboxypeptidase-like regulatory domain-containing protein, partial [Pedobacter sp.]|uniref:carboxypeptidase-like regulatory domain-containing protein n=1 Tax=Pedobacter sp. TaxID=1411316 RepID=UPI003D7F9084